MGRPDWDWAKTAYQAIEDLRGKSRELDDAWIDWAEKVVAGAYLDGLFARLPSADPMTTADRGDTT